MPDGQSSGLWYRRNPGARSSRAYLFFDELQVVPGWERFLRRVIDTEEAQVYVTGSSAKLLSTEVATSFRGRGLTVEVLPFGLRKAARSQGLNLGPSWPPASPLRSQIEALTDRYLEQGGFPEVQHLHGFDRVIAGKPYWFESTLRVLGRPGLSSMAPDATPTPNGVAKPAPQGPELVWTEQALARLSKIEDHIAADNPQAAAVR